MRGLWNDEFLRELENFPAGKHDDCVDAPGGAYQQIGGRGTPFDFERVNISRPGGAFGYFDRRLLKAEALLSGDRQNETSPPEISGTTRQNLRRPLRQSRVQGTCRIRKERPVTHTSNSFTLVSAWAVNPGLEAVQVPRSGMIPLTAETERLAEFRLKGNARKLNL